MGTAAGSSDHGPAPSPRGKRNLNAYASLQLEQEVPSGFSAPWFFRACGHRFKEPAVQPAEKASPAEAKLFLDQLILTSLQLPLSLQTKSMAPASSWGCLTLSQGAVRLCAQGAAVHAAAV